MGNPRNAMKKDEAKKVALGCKAKTTKGTTAKAKAAGKSFGANKRTKEYKGYYCLGNTEKGADSCELCNKGGASCVAYYGIEHDGVCGVCKTLFTEYKDNPFQHPYAHGASEEPKQDTPLEDATLFGDQMFPSEYSNAPGEFDFESTKYAFGEAYAKKCQEWLDMGGLPNSKTTQPTKTETEDFNNDKKIELSRDDPSNFTEEEKKKWKQFFDDDLVRMKGVLKEMGLLATEHT